jgi:site-specific recombinase XerD
MAVKIGGHGQAAILSHPEIELLFAEGLQSDRDRALFGVCLYTAARIAEACSMLTEDVYTPAGQSQSFCKHPESGNQRQTGNPHHPSD